MPPVTPYFMSKPTSRRNDVVCSEALVFVSRTPLTTYGLSLRSRPWLSDCSPTRLPAWLTRVRLYAFGIGAQNTCSFLRRMFRMKLMPHVCSAPSAKRSVASGMAISAVQPSSVIRAATSQIPSQFLLMLELTSPSPIRLLPSPSSEICCSSLAPSGVVTNM